MHRGVATAYGVLAATVGVLVLLGTGSYLAAGKIIWAAVILLGGMTLTAVLVALFLSVAGPDLRADRDGIRGRTGWRRPVTATWREVTVDTTEDSDPRQLRVIIGPHTVTITAAWAGFSDFVLLVASTPAAASSVTASARGELARLLRLDDQGGLA